MIFRCRGHPVTDDQLSAYADAALDRSTRARLESHLEACAPCRETLAELRGLRRAFQALPRATAPRSFALRTADVEASPRVAMPSWFAQVPAALGGLATAAVLAFGVLVAVDLSSGGSSQSATTGEVTSFDAAGGTGQEAYRSTGSTPGKAALTITDQPAAPGAPAATSLAPLPATGPQGNTSAAPGAVPPAATALVAGGSFGLVWWRRRSDAL